MTISMIVPARDQGTTFRRHVVDSFEAIAGLDAELIVVDNRSVDGCCRGLPPDVVIVRTARNEPPVRLWRFGWSVATGEALLWLPDFSSRSAADVRRLVQIAADVVSGPPSATGNHGPRRHRFTAVRNGPVLVTPSVRSRLDRWSCVPGLGFLASAAAVRVLPVTISLATCDGAAGGHSVPERSVGDGDRANAGALSSLADPPVDLAVHRGARRLSVIVTAHNEGDEVRRTIESVRANTRMDHEIILVDDGSTDGSCAGLEDLGVRLIRHTERIGVAYSRNAGTRAADGDVFAYLDGHQRVDPGSLDRCAEVAAQHVAITCAPCRPLRRRYPIAYGASFRLCPERGYFSARSRIDRPGAEVTRVSALHSPGYLIPRGVYDRVAWIGPLRGWGATDYSVAVKAFFADVDILLVNAGATEHLFRKRIPYETTWPGVWRNHALIARVCFDDRTWSRHWLPDIFRRNLPEETLVELDSPAVIAERDAFLHEKLRPDREFWRGLLRTHEPRVLT